MEIEFLNPNDINLSSMKVSRLRMSWCYWAKNSEVSSMTLIFYYETVIRLMRYSPLQSLETSVGWVSVSFFNFENLPVIGQFFGTIV